MDNVHLENYQCCPWCDDVLDTVYRNLKGNRYTVSARPKDTLVTKTAEKPGDIS